MYHFEEPNLLENTYDRHGGQFHSENIVNPGDIIWKTGTNNKLSLQSIEDNLKIGNTLNCDEIALLKERGPYTFSWEWCTILSFKKSYSWMREFINSWQQDDDGLVWEIPLNIHDHDKPGEIVFGKELPCEFDGLTIPTWVKNLEAGKELTEKQINFLKVNCLVDFENKWTIIKSIIVPSYGTLELWYWLEVFNLDSTSDEKSTVTRRFKKWKIILTVPRA